MQHPAVSRSAPTSNVWQLSDNAYRHFVASGVLFLALSAANALGSWMQVVFAAAVWLSWLAVAIAFSPTTRQSPIASIAGVSCVPTYLGDRPWRVCALSIDCDSFEMNNFLRRREHRVLE